MPTTRGQDGSRAHQEVLFRLGERLARDIRGTSTSATRGSDRPPGRRGTGDPCVGQEPTGDARQTRSSACASTAVLIAIVIGLLLAGCSADSGSGTSPTASPSAAAPSAAVAAPPLPPYRPSACYRLSLSEVTAPTSSVSAVPCRTKVDRPHLLRRRAGSHQERSPTGGGFGRRTAAPQQRVPADCRTTSAELPMPCDSACFGRSGSPHDRGVRRRCRLVALRCGGVGAARQAGEMTGRRPCALSTRHQYDVRALRHRRARRPGFKRVMCAEKHSWRALRTVDLAGKNYPGAKRARSKGRGTLHRGCSAEAEDALDFQWGYEWPTRSQWAGRKADQDRSTASAGRPPTAVESAGRRSSEAEFAQLARIALPVLGHLDVQLEENRRPQQRLDLLARGGADVAQPTALVADDDALLGVSLDVDHSVDVQQWLVLGPPGSQFHLVDHDGDRVRQLVANTFQSAPRGSGRRRSLPRGRR